MTEYFYLFELSLINLSICFIKFKLNWIWNVLERKAMFFSISVKYEKALLIGFINLIAKLHHYWQWRAICKKSRDFNHLSWIGLNFIWNPLCFFVVRSSWFVFVKWPVNVSKYCNLLLNYYLVEFLIVWFVCYQFTSML